MKAITISRFGGSEVLEYSDQPLPPYNSQQVLVEVHAAGVNPVDWKIREGYLAEVFPYEFPITLGWDMAGTVAEVGADIKYLNVGDRVYCYNRMELVKHGTYAEYAPADANTVARIPDNLDFPMAASIPLVALTAWQAIVEYAQVQAGEVVMIQAGAGGVGSYAIQIAKHFGASVIATAREHNHEYLHSLGADLAIDYQREDVKARVLEFAADGADIVFDCSGSDNVAVNFDYIKNGSGRMATINGLQFTVPILEECASKHKVKAELVFARAQGEHLFDISQLIANGKIKPAPIKQYSLEQAADALAENQAGHVRGKLVLNVK